jgi:hypothetical protein
MTVHQTTIGRGQYHQHQEMVDWCREHIGLGKWIEWNPNIWKEHDLAWTIDASFGYTTFYFKEQEHLAWFLLRWA